MHFTGAIIQARRTSTRFPDKVLQQLSGMSILEHCVERAKSARLVDKVVIAAPHEIPIKLDVDYFYGSESNVLDRYYQCADFYEFDVIVRLTADCPLVPPSEIDRVVHFFNSHHFDYAVSNTIDGWDVEVFDFDALEEAWLNATEPSDLEHVTPYLKRMNSYFLPPPKLSIDTPEDLERVKEFLNYELVR